MNSKAYLPLKQVLSAGRIHRGRNGHNMPASGGGDASILASASVPGDPDPRGHRNPRVSRCPVEFRRHSSYRRRPAAHDQDAAYLELAAAILRKLHDEQPLL